MRVKKAKDLGNLILRVLFTDDTEKDINVGEYIKRHPHPQYNKYSDPKHFKKFTIENGNVVWGKNWDLIFPIEDLYSGVLK